MAYQVWSVVFGEQPSASKWNILGTNDAGFHDGSNIDDGAIINRHITDGTLNLEKLNATVAFLATNNASQNSGNGSFAAMSFNTEIYDYGSDFASNEFTAPVDGVYSFKARTHTGDGSISRAILTLYVDRGSGYSEEARGVDIAATLNAGTGPNVAADLQLDAGDKVKVYSFYSSTKSLSANIPNTYFCGHLVGEV